MPADFQNSFSCPSVGISRIFLAVIICRRLLSADLGDQLLRLLRPSAVQPVCKNGDDLDQVFCQLLLSGHLRMIDDLDFPIVQFAEISEHVISKPHQTVLIQDDDFRNLFIGDHLHQLLQALLLIVNAGSDIADHFKAVAFSHHICLHIRDLGIQIVLLPVRADPAAADHLFVRLVLAGILAELFIRVVEGAFWRNSGRLQGPTLVQVPEPLNRYARFFSKFSDLHQCHQHHLPSL